GPFFLTTLGAWAFATEEGQRLRFADDREGTRWWHTAEEAAREAERVMRAERDAALARIAELEAKLGSG
ncbi:MAG: hypothetical protein ACXVEF_43485, partial [Polyangiales bacterium]